MMCAGARADLLVPIEMIVRRGRRAPAGDRAVFPAPYLWSLRTVRMPGARGEKAELLVQHLVELGKELDHVLVGIAVVDRDIVSGAVAQRSPDDRDAVMREHIATLLDRREVAHLEGDMVYLGALAADEVHGVVVRVAAHEHEEIPVPVRHLEAEYALIEIAGLLHVGNDEGAVAELYRADAHNLLVGGEVIPLGEHLDGSPLVVLEGQQLGRAR